MNKKELQQIKEYFLASGVDESIVLSDLASFENKPVKVKKAFNNPLTVLNRFTDKSSHEVFESVIINSDGEKITYTCLSSDSKVEYTEFNAAPYFICYIPFDQFKKAYKKTNTFIFEKGNLILNGVKLNTSNIDKVVNLIKDTWLDYPEEKYTESIIVDFNEVQNLVPFASKEVTRETLNHVLAVYKDNKTVGYCATNGFGLACSKSIDKIDTYIPFHQNFLKKISTLKTKVKVNYLVDSSRILYYFEVENYKFYTMAYLGNYPNLFDIIPKENLPCTWRFTFFGVSNWIKDTLPKEVDLVKFEALMDSMDCTINDKNTLFEAKKNFSLELAAPEGMKVFRFGIDGRYFMDAAKLTDSNVIHVRTEKSPIQFDSKKYHILIMPMHIKD